MSVVTRGGSHDGAAAATAAAARTKPKPDDFVFGKMIGEGSFSSVFLARDASADVTAGKTFKEYAIKVCEKKRIVHESKSEYIFREKDILASITKHYSSRVPFFVLLHSTFHDHERFYFTMTYARNGDLLKFIDKMAERDIDCVQFYAAELLAAVEFLHFKVGVIHRDLKPENILLNHRMHILITDFGSAKFIKEKYNITNNRTKQRLITPENDSSEDDDDEGDDGVESVSKAMENTGVSEGGATAATAATSSPGNPPSGGSGSRQQPRRRRARGDDDDDSDSDLPSQRGSKRRSFVGTAQYLSPEILTSRGSCRASDLWAIGCIIYQMITGLPPFQSDSDWVIFKKIEKLDYTFQEGFDKKAESLIKQLLVIDPDARLGARNKKCYDTVKQHPFFQGVDFESLPDSSPPGLDRPEEEELVDPVWLKEPDAKPGAGRLAQLELDSYCDSDEGGQGEEDTPTSLLFPSSGMVYLGNPKNNAAVKNQMSETSASGQQGASGLQPTAEAIRKRLTKNHVLQSAELSQIDRDILINHQTSSNKFHRFTEGNLILKEGILDKKKGLLARRRMFLLTEGPKLYYVDPGRMELKGQVPLTKEVKMEIKDPRIFFLHTPGRIYYLLDPKSTAQDWCQAVEDVIARYFSSDQSTNNS